MNFVQIFLLGLIQGAAELLPVSSSAHVIVAEKLMRLDAGSPELTFLLVMLHCGTMLAVILYFWRSWQRNYFSSWAVFQRTVVQVGLATVLTGVVYLGLSFVIKKVFFRHSPHAEIETFMVQLPVIWVSLLAVGLLILLAARREGRGGPVRDLQPREAGIIGLMQGLCLPFRGFSRSGATISTGLLLGIDRRKCEEFSFALAVVLTPPVVARELLRLLKNHSLNSAMDLQQLLLPGVFGMLCSFGAGLLALALLSKLLEEGKWRFFGYYCLAAALAVFCLWQAGY